MHQRARRLRVELPVCGRDGARPARAAAARPGLRFAMAAFVPPRAATDRPRHSLCVTSARASTTSSLRREADAPQTDTKAKPHPRGAFLRRME